MSPSPAPGKRGCVGILITLQSSECIPPSHQNAFITLHHQTVFIRLHSVLAVTEQDKMNIYGVSPGGQDKMNLDIEQDKMNLDMEPDKTNQHRTRQDEHDKMNHVLQHRTGQDEPSQNLTR